MDLFFSRFSHPHMSVEEGIQFNGNVVDSQGKPYHLEISIDGESMPRFCEFSITSPNSSWFAISSNELEWCYKLRKENPLRKEIRSKYSQLLCAEISIKSDFGSFDIYINDTMISLTDFLPF